MKQLIAKNSIDNRKQTGYLFLFNVFALCFTFVFSGKNNFSIDSYGILHSEYRSHIEAFIGSYRFSGAGIFRLLRLFGHDPIRNATPAVCFYIIVVAAAITWLTFRMIKTIGNKPLIAVDLAVLISTVNCWYCDILSFPECVMITGIGTALVFIAIGSITGDGIKKTGRCVCSAVCLITATGIYQQYLAVFAVYVIALYCVTVIQKKNNTLKEQLMVFAKPAIIWLSSGCIYFVIAKAVCGISKIQRNTRIANGIGDIVHNALHILRNIHSYIKGRGFFHSEILTVCFLIMLLIFACNLIVYFFREKNAKSFIILGIASVCAVLCSLLAAFLSCNTGYRAMFPFFAIYGFLAIVIPESTKKISEKLLYIILLAVVLLNIGKSVESELTQKYNNTAENMWAEQVFAEIDSYEQKSGNKIKNIVVCNDDKCDLTRNGLSAVEFSYSLTGLLQLHAEGRSVTIEISPEIHTEIFNNKNWEHYMPSEQLNFSKDTVYLSCY